MPAPGKSRHAEALVADSPQVLYLATSQIVDDEMAHRIQHHAMRLAHWRTVERWHHLDEVITPRNDPQEAVLLECMTTMVTNMLFAQGRDPPDDWDYAAMERMIDDEIHSLIVACQRCPAKVVLVTNEVGMGIVPENRLARHFRDIAGRLTAWRRRQMRSGWWYQVLESKLNDQIILGNALFSQPLTGAGSLVSGA